MRIEEPSPVRFDPPIVVERDTADADGRELDDRAFLRGLVHGMRCGILTIDNDRRVRLLNRVGRRILGLPHVHEGEPLALALADHPRVIEVLEESFSMTTLPSRAELELGRVSGSGKTIGFTLSHVALVNGKPRGTAMFFKDLTPIEHDEEQGRLRDRLAELGAMAAGVAHEIRNPLASIEVTCTLLRRKLASDAATVEQLDKILAEVRRMNSTVGSTLELVEPLALELELTPLESALEQAISAATARRPDPGIALERRYGCPSAAILMDRSLMGQAFEHLLLNSLEALDGRGKITVQTELIEGPGETIVPYLPASARRREARPASERFAVVRISDDGPGIPEADLGQIWSPLFTTKRQGSGIGLALVRKIVSTHRGLIDVQSRPGAGVEFTVRLPMTVPTPEARGT